MLKTFVYEHKGKQYDVNITRKRIKNITFRFKNGAFYVSCPYLVSKVQILKGLDKYADKLIGIDRGMKGKDKNEIYIFGTKVTLSSNNVINFSDGSTINYKDEKDLENKLKKLLLKVIEPRVRYYEIVMGIKNPYKVRVKKMTSRYGSNSSRTRSLAFSLTLVHYSSYIVDAVIVHELAHDFQRNHSKRFYDVVEKFYPQYKIYIKKLKKGQFS